MAVPGRPERKARKIGDDYPRAQAQADAHRDAVETLTRRPGERQVRFRGTAPMMLSTDW
jgi:hypothetical protein